MCVQYVGFSYNIYCMFENTLVTLDSVLRIDIKVPQLLSIEFT